MSYTIVRVRTAADWREFLNLPHRLHRADPCYVPQLNSEVRRTLDAKRNPYFRQAPPALFLCFREGEPVARCAVHLNEAHAVRFGKRVLFFGFFETENDEGAVAELFAEVAHFGRMHHAVQIEGPFNPHHYSELGLQLTHFNTRPTVFQTSNPPYYHPLLASCGFSLLKTLHTRRNFDIRAYIQRRYGTQRFSAVSSDYTVRTLRTSDRHAELGRIREVYNDAFAGNWHFLPLTGSEYLFSAKYLSFVTRPDLNVIVEYRSEPVGVLQFLLDVNPLLQRFQNGRLNLPGLVTLVRARRTIRRAVIYAVGIKKRFQHSRVYALLLDKACEIAMHFDELETTWMTDDNMLALHAAEHLGLERDREFGIFARSIS